MPVLLSFLLTQLGIFTEIPLNQSIFEVFTGLNSLFACIVISFVYVFQKRKWFSNCPHPLFKHLGLYAKHISVASFDKRGHLLPSVDRFVCSTMTKRWRQLKHNKGFIYHPIFLVKHFSEGQKPAAYRYFSSLSSHNKILCSTVQMCWWGPSWDCSLPACVIDSTTLHLRTLILTGHCVTERLFQQHKSANSPASTTFYPSK